MFSGLALKSYVVWITKKRDISDSIINLILQSFERKLLKTLDFLQLRRLLAFTFIEMVCTGILFKKKAEHHLFCYLQCPMVSILKAILNLES